jgi:DNA-binding PadR family transcriptional regulator
VTGTARDRGSRWQRGFLGHYALTVLERGPIYAHQLSTRISTRSQGLWQPSPGAVYPAFRSLVSRGLVRTEREGGRRLYYITTEGRRHLSTLRADRTRWAERFGGSWRLMFDMMEPDQRVPSALQRLRHTLAMEAALIEGQEEDLTPTERATLRKGVRAELTSALERLSVRPGRGSHSERGRG